MSEKNSVQEAELGEFALRQADELAFPPTEWEATTLAKVLALPRVLVGRPPQDQLVAAGMRHNDCHVNCSSEADAYPADVRHVTGWLIYGHMLVLHSVIEVRGQLRCVTPQIAPSPSSFEFIPDPEIRWRISPDGKRMMPLRDGIEVSSALRKYPEHHIRMRDELRKLIASGMTAFEARRVVDSTLGAELRERAAI